MRHKFTNKERRRGGLNTHKKHPEKAIKLTKNWSKIQDKTGKGRLVGAREEREVTERIRKDYDDIFAPNAVCDKIGFKDGKIFFIEIKRKGQGLRHRQEKFRSLVKEDYIVEYVSK